MSNAVQSRVAKPAVVEKNVDYRGEDATWASFFMMFPQVIFRWHGSALPRIWVQFLLSIGISVVAIGLRPTGYICGPPASANISESESFESPCGTLMMDTTWATGHQIVGVLLAFLLVFRSQIAWSLFWEGRMHWGCLTASTKFILTMLMCSLAPQKHGSNETDHPYAAEELLEAVRLTKLYIISVVEHIRSSDGGAAWAVAHEVLLSVATPNEIDELMKAFGGPQQGTHRGTHQFISQQDFRSMSLAVAGMEPEAAMDRKRNTIASSLGLQHAQAAIERMKQSHPLNRRDPTSAKPMVVLIWLRCAPHPAPHVYDFLPCLLLAPVSLAAVALALTPPYISEHVDPLPSLRRRSHFGAEQAGSSPVVRAPGHRRRHRAARLHLQRARQD